jgi:biotin transporter BioY
LCAAGAASASVFTPLVAAGAPVFTPLVAAYAPLVTPLHPKRLRLGI